MINSFSLRRECVRARVLCVLMSSVWSRGCFCARFPTSSLDFSEGFWIYAVQKRTLGSLCLSLYRARAKVFAHKRVHYWIRIIMCSIMFSFLCTMMMIMIIERVI
jgi:hypothetical protein